MTYYCSDCTYRGQTAAPAGDCPACGSFAMVHSRQAQEEAPPSKVRLYLMFVLWGVFLSMVVWKLIS